MKLTKKAINDLPHYFGGLDQSIQIELCDENSSGNFTFWRFNSTDELYLFIRKMEPFVNKIRILLMDGDIIIDERRDPRIGTHENSIIMRLEFTYNDKSLLRNDLKIPKAKQQRKNALSFTQGGSRIVVVYKSRFVVYYDNVKYPKAYIKATMKNPKVFTAFEI